MLAATPIAFDAMVFSLADLGGSDGFAEFNVLEPWEDADPTVDGVQITYSYSNFLDGDLRGGLLPKELIAATEEALGLWASAAPLHFIELPDSGPLPTPADADYSAGAHPQIRIGHHFIDGQSRALAHAFFPGSGGLDGDVHFDNGDVWALAPGEGLIDVIEVMTHEVGHALGLGHEFVDEAIMNPIYGGRFSGRGTGFLFPDDILGIRALYGEGAGSVAPLRPLTVDTLEDTDDGNTKPGDLSLREALKLIDKRTRGRAIDFAEELAGQTIVLQSTLTIPGNVEIIGLGSQMLTIAASDPNATPGNGMQIFVVDDDDDELFSPVRISGLTLRGADAAKHGGAIFSNENLTLNDVRLLDNRTTQRGGAIYTLGNLSISGSTLDGNQAGSHGGAIYSLGSVEVDRTTLANNRAAGRGGAIEVDSPLVQGGSSIVIRSSTISGNQSTGSGGGIHSSDFNLSRFAILHSTLTRNRAGGSGGGVYLYNGVLELSHSIVAGNSDNGQAPDIDNINNFADPGALVNRSAVGSSRGADLQQLGGGNFIGVAGAVFDPMLGPLADNGGPTLTHALLEGSPLVDAGDDRVALPPLYDQRGAGFDRIISGAIDIGAIEVDGFSINYLVDTLVDESDGNFLPGDVSLREILQLANADLGKDRIMFAPSLSGGVIVLNPALGALRISDSVTVDATVLTHPLTIDASAADPTPTLANGDGVRVLRIDDGNANLLIDVELKGFEFRGGDVEGDGGALLSTENLLLSKVAIQNNHATGSGGGLHHKDGLLTIEFSVIAENSAAADGGGLYSNTSLEGAIGEVKTSTISGNSAGDQGGGIFNFDGLLKLQSVTMTNNSAVFGGGVVSFGDPATQTSVESSIIAGNLNHDVQKSRNIAYSSFVSTGYNLVGTGNGTREFDEAGDTTDVVDPQLGPLVNNGGSTRSHLPLPGSPAIDAGNADVTGEGEFDQRGTPFARRADGDANGVARVDIGAIERPEPTPDADFDSDNDVDGFDFLALQRGLGMDADARPAQGDADSNGKVDERDVNAWEQGLGVPRPANATHAAVHGAIASPSIGRRWQAAAETVSQETDRPPVGGSLVGGSLVGGSLSGGESQLGEAARWAASRPSVAWGGREGGDRDGLSGNGGPRNGASNNGLSSDATPERNQPASDAESRDSAFASTTSHAARRSRPTSRSFLKDVDQAFADLEETAARGALEM